jgi:hypothetical protein
MPLSRLLILTLLTVSFSATPSSVVSGRRHAGVELTCDLPADQHVGNRGSRVDGRGMCVMASIEMAARWQGLASMCGLCDWCANQPGGADPDKVDRQLNEFCMHLGISVPHYIQYQGKELRTVLEWCERTGRMACITYGWSPRYGGTISHMTCCAKFGDRWAVCLDCNFPGDNSYEWMSHDEMIRRIGHPNGSGWVFVWLAPSPPPPPHN